MYVCVCLHVHMRVYIYVSCYMCVHCHFEPFTHVHLCVCACVCVCVWYNTLAIKFIFSVVSDTSHFTCTCAVSCARTPVLIRVEPEVKMDVPKLQ